LFCSTGTLTIFPVPTRQKPAFFVHVAVPNVKNMCYLLYYTVVVSCCVWYSHVTPFASTVNFSALQSMCTTFIAVTPASACIARALTAHVTIIRVECQVLCMVVCVGVQFVQGVLFSRCGTLCSLSSSMAGAGPKNTMHVLYILYGSNLHIYPHLFAVKRQHLSRVRLQRMSL